MILRAATPLGVLLVLLAGPAIVQTSSASPPPAPSAAVPGDTCKRNETARQCYERALAVAADSVRAQQARGATAAAERSLSLGAALMNDACERGESTACYYYARLTDEGLASDSVQARRSADLYAEACGNADPVADACHRLGDAFAYGLGRPTDSELAVAYYERGCRLGSGSSCQKASVRYDERTAAGWTVSGLSRAQRSALAREYAERGCAFGSPNSCVTAGWHRGWSSESDLEEVGAAERESLRLLFTSACASGNTAGCNNLGVLFKNGWLKVPAAADSARHYFQRACTGTGDDARHGLGCENLGDMFASGRTGSANPDSARFYYAAGCELQHAGACRELADIRPDSLYLTEDMAVLSVACMESGEACVSAGYLAETALGDLETARFFYLRACSAGDGVGCSNLAGSRFNIDTGRSHAVKYARLGCDLREAAACERMHGQLFGLDSGLAGYYRDRACELGGLWSCAESSRISETQGISLSGLHSGLVAQLAVPDSVRRDLLEARAGSLYYDLYAFPGVAGTSITFDLESDAFDAFMVIGSPLGSDSLKVIDYDDDGGDGNNSRLVFIAPETRQYIVQVRSYDGSGQGGYRLRLEPGADSLAIPRPAWSRRRFDLPAKVFSLPPTDSVVARLSEKVTDDMGGNFYQDWMVSAVRGVPLTVSVHSGDFDPYLRLGRVENNQLVSLTTNDDWNGTDSRVRFTPGADGSYVIRVLGIARGTGEYRIRVDRGLAAPDRREIRAGEERTGTLGLHGAMLEDGSPYQEYTYTGTAGERLEVALTSDEFDTFLVIGRMEAQPVAASADGVSPEPAFIELARAIAHPDDPARRSRLVLSLREAGEYIIRVNTFGPEQGGDYALKVDTVRLEGHGIESPRTGSDAEDSLRP